MVIDLNFQSTTNSFEFFDYISNSNFSQYVDLANNFLCQENLPTSGLCEAAVSMLCGNNKDGLELDTRIMQDFMKHKAHTVSIKQINHFSQLHASGKFRQYDYKYRNKIVYNSSQPTDYKLEDVKAPIYLYSGDCDVLVSEIDVEHLEQVLPNVQVHRSVKNYNHCDFNYGKHSRSVLFMDILEAFNKENIKKSRHVG